MTALPERQYGEHISGGCPNMEKRVHRRIQQACSIAVRVSTPSGADSEGTLLRLTQDISHQGLRFSHNTSLAEGTPVHIHLALDMPRKIVTHQGEVRWAKQLKTNEPFTIGVEFTATEPSDMQAWSRYLDERLALLS